MLPARIGKLSLQERTDAGRKRLDRCSVNEIADGPGRQTDIQGYFVRPSDLNPN